MDWNFQDLNNLPLVFCGIFYAVLCIFSIVTGVIYMSGKKELNPLELSDGFVARLNSPEKRLQFTRRMGLVTFIVGIVQGVTAWSILRGRSQVYYWIAVGFTVFSICSVVFKLKNKINAFPLLKLICYALILLILLLESTRALFF